jgi:DNA-binding XRE family transcriptional regulator
VNDKSYPKEKISPCQENKSLFFWKMMSIINNRIKIIRQELKLTQKELAEIIGVKWYQIKDIETGKTKPSIDIISSMCEHFAIDSIWLLTGKSHTNNPSEQNEKIKKFKTVNEGQDAINALITIEQIDERTFRRTVADLKYIADKLKEGATPGPLINVSENKILGELTKEKDRI